MRVRTQKAGGTVARRGLGLLVPSAAALCVLVFLWAVSLFFSSKTGFTSLISIGDILNDSKVTTLRQVPHYVYDGSAGYDGAYYAQLALHPTLDNPELNKAIDNLPYRARRILFCWTAWLLGLGQPAWILQAHALLNVFSWLGLAGLLWRWFPPHTWGNFLRWFGVMFSHGVCMSVRHSLVDGPSLLLVAMAMACLESGRRTRAAAVLAFAGLGKETNLLAVAGFAEPASRSGRTWMRFAGTALAIAVPLLAWMAFIRIKFGPAEDPGLGNFTWPLSGLAEKWADAAAVWVANEDPWLAWGTVGSTLALTVQMLFFVGRWRPAEAWWRVGAVFAFMMLFLSTPVWEGYPGAFTRVLLPMTLAFNVLVPRGARWLPLLLIGNLSVISTYREVTPPAREFFRVKTEQRVAGTVTVTAGPGWYGPENGERSRWRWSNGDSELRIHNAGQRALRLKFDGRMAGTDERHVRILAGGTVVWSGEVHLKATTLQFECVAPPGEMRLRFVADLPARNVGTDPRRLSFNVSNLDIVVGPLPGQP